MNEDGVYALESISKSLSKISTEVSLRDLYACFALAGSIARNEDADDCIEDVVNDCYLYADSMILARKGKVTNEQVKQIALMQQKNTELIKDVQK